MAKRYMFSITEEGIRNPNFAGYCGGRIEIFDNESSYPKNYPIAEYRFLIPTEFMDGFMETFDGKETDKPIMIKWDMFDLINNNR